MKAVLIVEQQPLVSEVMRDLLMGWDDGIRSTVCADAESTIAQVRDRSVDWFRIFLELDVAGSYGLSLAKDIQREGLHQRCCILTSVNKPELIAEIQAMGFLGYIVKSSSFADFARALNRVLSGDRYFPPSTLILTHRALHLTPRQAQLLDGVRRGLSSKDIASAYFLTEGTVNNAITAAMRALDVTSRSHAVAKAIELGLLELNAKLDVRAPRRASKRAA